MSMDNAMSDKYKRRRRAVYAMGVIAILLLLDYRFICLPQELAADKPEMYENYLLLIKAQWTLFGTAFTGWLAAATAEDGWGKGNDPSFG